MRIIITCLIFVGGLLTWTIARAGTDRPAITHTVVIENMKFTPANLHIRLGDKVIFKNVDLVPHTATAKDTKRFDSGILLENQTWEYQPKATGTIPYHCIFHPLMEGALKVEPLTPEICQ